MSLSPDDPETKEVLMTHRSPIELEVLKGARLLDVPKSFFKNLHWIRSREKSLLLAWN